MHNIYDKLEDDNNTTPMTYKTSWLLDTAASGNYADQHTKVLNRKRIKRGTGVNVGCANNGSMSQTEEGELPFDNIPAGAEDVQMFENMHSPLLSGRKFVEKGCTLVFDTPNAHVVNGRTGDKIQKIIADAEHKENDDIVMTVPFDRRTLTRKIDADGQAKPLFNIASNVHQVRSKEVLCDCLHWAAGYPVKKRGWQQ